MQLFAHIEQMTDETWRATLIGLPQLWSIGYSQEAALTLLRQAAQNQLDAGVIVPFSMPATELDNPWLVLGDRLAANPLLDEVIEQIAAARSQDD